MSNGVAVARWRSPSLQATQGRRTFVQEIPSVHENHVFAYETDHSPMETDMIIQIVVLASLVLAVGLYLFLYR